MSEETNNYQLATEALNKVGHNPRITESDMLLVQMAQVHALLAVADACDGPRRDGGAVVMPGERPVSSTTTARTVGGGGRLGGVRAAVTDEWDEVMVVLSRQRARSLAADLAATAGPGSTKEGA